MKLTGLKLSEPLKAPCVSGITEMAPLSRPVFVSDLHLSGRNKKTVLGFLWFLKTQAKNYDELFLLGDIFEYWIGDDASSPAEPLARALRKYATLGKRVYLMQGNRDFLIGEDFARHCGAELVADGTVVDCSGKRILLSHGDKWCTLDDEYQEFRRQMHDEAFQLMALRMTVEERIDFAKKARAQSKKTKTERSREMMDVVYDDVACEVSAKNCAHVIHGHTHRPAHYVYDNFTRTVIPDWDLDDKNRPRKGWVEINSAGERFEARFHCREKPCFMTIVQKESRRDDE